VSVFTEAELAYLTGGRRLGRVATVGADSTPPVVPVGWRYDADDDVIVVRGHKLERTKKFRDARRSGRAALVMGDFENITPWRPRGVEVRGRPRRSTGPGGDPHPPRANRVVGPGRHRARRAHGHPRPARADGARDTDASR
jgi:pyridoxamine 5'-phosphate oxidase family protein